MAMFRALSTRKSRRGYEQLGGDHHHEADPKLSRARTLPARVLGSFSTSVSTKTTSANPAAKAVSEQVKKVSKVHPFFSLFQSDTKSRKKKATARPEFSRYLEYLKEGGFR